ncbi:MAG: hypothetical protein LQ343_001486 [Gyalolechia ehrenbergii]|nr:MAG: hypothetical protein LQ343_001486 [Gyalolechia ehrenbergii]
MSVSDRSRGPHKLAPSQEIKHVKLPAYGADDQRRPERLEEHFLASNRSHYSSARQSWQRPQSPGLKWHKHYDTPESRKRGRVLVIDYVKKSHAKEGMRKVVTQEFDNIQELRRLYTNPERGSEAVLRVFHVQNADWATHYLLRKFNITARDDLVGTDFGHYVKNKHRERRGKPLLTGRSWKTTHDPWRSINRTSFGLDYLKPYSARKADAAGRMMELSCYDEDENPTYGWDVHAQRLSCYVQHKEPPSDVPGYPDIENPYEAGTEKDKPHNYFPRLESLDNGNTIIIFEKSCSGSIDDTMVLAREKWESRWRRLPFYLAYESHDVSNDDQMALECMKIILADIWKSVSESWDCLIDLSNVHVDCLQDRIYEQPADETRAPELWTNASNWLKVERLVTIHTNVVKEMQNNLRELAGGPTVQDNWLEDSPSDMERISTLYATSASSTLFTEGTNVLGSVQEDLVDTFSDDPSIKWYFAATVPLMLLVLILWYIVKHVLARRRQTPYTRGLYESLYRDLATSYPSLWSRSGPRQFIRPQGMMGRIKWSLILYWNRPEKTVRSDADSVDDDLGAWARCKRMLTRRWTWQLRRTAPVGVSSSSLEEGSADGLGVISDGVSGVTELLALPATENAENLPGGMLRLPVSPGAQARRQRASPQRSSLERPSSKGSSATRDSGILIEEEALNWLQELGRRSQEFTERISGPSVGQDRPDSRSDNRRDSSVATGSPEEGSKS